MQKLNDITQKYLVLEDKILELSGLAARKIGKEKEYKKTVKSLKSKRTKAVKKIVLDTQSIVKKYHHDFNIYKKEAQKKLDKVLIRIPTIQKEINDFDKKIVDELNRV